MMIPFPAALRQRRMLRWRQFRGRLLSLLIEGYVYEMGNSSSR
jgi:hypothetical protein